MTKSKFLSISVVALIVLNLAILAFQFFNKGAEQRHFPPHHGREKPKNYIIKKLHFDDQQITDYEALIEIHREHIGEIEAKIHTEKQALFSLLSESNPNQEKSLLNRIAKLSSGIDSLHMDHFKAIKALCKEEQLKDFDELSKELAKIFGRPGPPRPEKRHR